MASTGDTLQRILIVGFVLAFPVGGLLSGPGYDGWVAWRGESDEVTGATAVEHEGELYLVVSGFSERTTQRSGKQHGVSTTDFPRLTSWRASDGEQVAMRQYAPVYLRWTYVDTVVRALASGPGRAWVVSTERAVGLHAVHPLTLEDVMDQAALTARVPALAAGLHVAPAGNESPVLFDGRELLLQVESGPWLAIDPVEATGRDLGVEGKEWSELQRAGDLRGDPAIEARAQGKPGRLEPEVVAVLDAGGRPDRTASYVLTQTILDRQTAGVHVTRWDTSGPEPRETWTAEIPGVHPDCCQRRVWRWGGLAVVWNERWLAGLDDATGSVRWVRRL